MISAPVYIPPIVYLTVSWEICMQDKKQELKLDMEQWIGSKLRKEYFKAAYCHSSYLTYMQTMSCKMLDLMSPKGWNQDCWEKYQQPQICEWYQSNGRKRRGTKEPLDESEREWKAGLKLNIRKAKIMASDPVIYMANRRGKGGSSDRFPLLGP